LATLGSRRCMYTDGCLTIPTNGSEYVECSSEGELLGVS
jgi:hypothetical protein